MIEHHLEVIYYLAGGLRKAIFLFLIGMYAVLIWREIFVPPEVEEFMMLSRSAAMVDELLKGKDGFSIEVATKSGRRPLTFAKAEAAQNGSQEVGA